jgi:hypothetical protein
MDTLPEQMESLMLGVRRVSANNPGLRVRVNLP